MDMDIVFVRSEHRRVPTVVTREDGVRLSVPVFGPLEPMPHDLVHFVVERELGLGDGFWGSVAAGAIFDGSSVRFATSTLASVTARLATIISKPTTRSLSQS